MDLFQCQSVIADRRVVDCYRVSVETPLVNLAASAAYSHQAAANAMLAQAQHGQIPGSHHGMPGAYGAPGAGANAYQMSNASSSR